METTTAPMVTDDVGSGDVTQPFIPPPPEDFSSTTIIVIVVVFVILFLAAIALRIWYFRRKNGHWPIPFKRERAPSPHLRPFGDKSYAARWQERATKLSPQRSARSSPNRSPAKPIFSVVGAVLEQKSEFPPKQRTIAETVEDEVTVIVEDGNSMTDFPQKKMRKSKSCDFGDEIGVYHDRTLPATLMMSYESKSRLFAKEQETLKRSNSATLRNSGEKLRSRKSLAGNNGRRPISANLQKYNDFFGMRRVGNGKAPSSSRLSNKPSNTSDYVSDFDGSVLDVNRARIRANANRLRAADRRKRVSDCDSAIHEFAIAEAENDKAESVLQALRLNISMEAMFGHLSRATAGISAVKTVEDDRTESQQNTVRIGSMSDLIGGGDADEDAAMQSSDTESMAGSFSRASFRSRRRMYDSDGGTRTFGSTSRRRKSTQSSGKRRCRRTRSDGMDSEPSTQKGKRRNSRQRESPVSSSKTVKLSKDVHNKQTSKPTAYNSASLKHPIGGTVIEMPIYAQATWSGPGSTTKRSRHRKPKLTKKSKSASPLVFAQNQPNRASSARSPRKQTKFGRHMSISGNGRYVCEYDTLPVDLSRLPADLVLKIGGRPDKLLEPIDQLNFDKLCRPLPALGDPDGQLSARKPVFLPANHQDREILANTYQYEGTGLVTTDL